MKMEILNMMEIMLMQIKKEMEFGIMKMVHIIKEHLSIIQEMEKDNYIIKMEILYMMEIGLMEKWREMG